jgi:hypothetical protein
MMSAKLLLTHLQGTRAAGQVLFRSVSPRKATCATICLHLFILQSIPPQPYLVFHSLQTLWPVPTLTTAQRSVGDQPRDAPGDLSLTRPVKLFHPACHWDPPAAHLGGTSYPHMMIGNRHRRVVQLPLFAICFSTMASASTARDGSLRKLDAAPLRADSPRR